LNNKKFYAKFNVEKRKTFLNDLILYLDNRQSAFLVGLFKSQSMPVGMCFSFEKIDEYDYKVHFISHTHEYNLTFNLPKSLVERYFKVINLFSLKTELCAIGKELYEVVSSGGFISCEVNGLRRTYLNAVTCYFNDCSCEREAANCNILQKINSWNAG